MHDISSDGRSNDKHGNVNHLNKEYISEFALTNLLASKFLNHIGSKVTTFSIRIGADSEFRSEAEHFYFDSSGEAITRKSTHEQVIGNNLLLNSIILHELYHGSQHGFSSYEQALEIIKAFNVSDIVRIDLEADLETYLFLKQQTGCTFEDYCSSVILTYSDLFGSNNKSFADFARFVGKLYTLSGRVGQADTTGMLIVPATQKAGWIEDDEYTRVRVQIVKDRSTQFQELVLPTDRLLDLKSAFWGGAHRVNEARSKGNDIEAEQEHVKQMKALLSAINESTFRSETQ